MTTKAGIVAALKIKVPAIAIGTAGPKVASRAVATAARIAAVDPCGQLARIQNPLTKNTASAARSAVHSAATGSLECRKAIRRRSGVPAAAKFSWASAYSVRAVKNSHSLD